jgi:hypothetical protein
MSYDLPPSYPVLYGSDIKVRVFEREGRLCVVVLDTFAMRDALVQHEAVEGAALLVEYKSLQLVSPAVLRAGVEALQTLADMWKKIADEMDPQPVKRSRHHMLQAINFSYGQLAASEHHRPVREAFAKLAAEIGMAPEEFEAWAADKKWKEDELGQNPDTTSTAPIERGYFSAPRRGPYEVRQRRDGDYDARLLPDGAWNRCPAAYYRGEFTPAEGSIRERTKNARDLVKHIDYRARPNQSHASDVMPPAEPWPGALAGMAPPWITDEPLSAEVKGAGEQWFPPTPDELWDLLSLVVEAPPHLDAIERWTVEQLRQVETWVAATVADANDHDDVEIPPYPSCLGPTKNGIPEPCGACRKTGHITGTCPELRP